MAENKQRCWPGYEPVPGKPEHSQGSCKPKAKSKLKPSEEKFQAKRRKQLAGWQAEHKGSPRKAAQHLAAPGAKEATAKTKAVKKSPSRKITRKAV